MQYVSRKKSNLISQLATLLLIILMTMTINIIMIYNHNTTYQPKTAAIDSSRLVYNIRNRSVDVLESIKNKEVNVTESRTITVSQISVHTDLSVMMPLNADQMNEIIAYWCRYNPDSPFINNGQIFIDASNETGLDPVYILAHAGLESGWGMSKYAKAGNFFGIGAYDYNPDNALKYGNNSVEAGIINGAIWIKENYYDNGQTSLYTMRYSDSGTHDYCTSNTWMNEIAKIIKTSYSLVQ